MFIGPNNVATKNLFIKNVGRVAEAEEEEEQAGEVEAVDACVADGSCPRAQSERTPPRQHPPPVVSPREVSPVAKRSLPMASPPPPPPPRRCAAASAAAAPTGPPPGWPRGFVFVSGRIGHAEEAAYAGVLNSSTRVVVRCIDDGGVPQPRFGLYAAASMKADARVCGHGGMTVVRVPGGEGDEAGAGGAGGGGGGGGATARPHRVSRVASALLGALRSVAPAPLTAAEASAAAPKLKVDVVLSELRKCVTLKLISSARRADNGKEVFWCERDAPDGRCGGGASAAAGAEGGARGRGRGRGAQPHARPGGETSAEDTETIVID